MLTFADELKQSSIETWQGIINHRFVVEIYNDTLPMDKFVFYLKQDQIFLEEFCRFLSVAKLKSDNDADLVKLFDGLLYSTVNFEMKMQDQIIVDSLSLSPLEQSSSSTTNLYVLPSKTTIEHITYLKRVSSNCSIGEIVSAMAPCPWTYLEIAEKLAKSHHIQNNMIYKKWVQFYSSDESRRQINHIKTVLCALADDKARSDDIDRLAMKKHFATACKYEFLFWDMAYRHQV
ncbi:MAG: thiaminase II [Nitrososphaeraceae archaeon]|nr:thiaminase II [Nitrososphaeraceae archaeon]MBV9667904.1 thiaminase II [Nitrososphaeraceae archaeon]